MIVLARHLDALTASLTLAVAQVEAARHALALGAPVPPSVPARCAAVPADRCAERDGEWDISQATFGDPLRRRCAGCGVDTVQQSP